MAEVLIPVPTEKVWFKFLDSAGAATYTPQFVIAKAFSFSPELSYANEEILVQDQGAAFIYEIVFNGVKAGGRAKIKFGVKDVKNAAATDQTLHAFLTGLVSNTFTTPAAFSGWVNANPTVSAARFMVKMQINLKDAGGSGVNHVLTGACIVESITDIAPAGEHLEYEASFWFPQKFVRT